MMNISSLLFCLICLFYKEIQSFQGRLPSTSLSLNRFLFRSRWKEVKLFSKRDDDFNPLKTPQTLEDLNPSPKPTINQKGFGRTFKKSIYDQVKEKQFQELVQRYADDPNKRRIIGDTVNFPGNFMLKVIGIDTNQTLAQDVLSIVQNFLRNSSSLDSPSTLQQSTNQNTSISTPIKNKTIPYKITTSPSNTQLISITIEPYFLNANQVYDCYEQLGKDQRIKVIL